MNSYCPKQFQGSWAIRPEKLLETMRKCVLKLDIDVDLFHDSPYSRLYGKRLIVYLVLSMKTLTLVSC